MSQGDIAKSRHRGTIEGERNRMSGTFVSIDGPDARATIASAINAQRDIVGRYDDQGNRVHGFILDGEGRFETIDVDVSGADLTVARGINDQGDIVGMYRRPETGFPERRHGFVRTKGRYLTIDFPGPPGTNTFAWNLNGSGVIVGVVSFPADGFREHGFVLANGVWTQIDHPAAFGTVVSDVDSRGTVIGTWKDESGAEHGFLLHEGALTELRVTNSESAFFDAIRESGTTTGVYTDSATHLRRGFVMDRDGRVTTIEYPGLTVVRDINRQGDLVGRYVAGRTERGYVNWLGYEGD